MARCATCGESVGFFGKKWRRLDGARHCVDCAPNVMAQRRQATREAIMAGSAPQVVLTAEVISRDLDYPGNSRRYTGAVLLTDKGVVFAQYGEYKKAEGGMAMFGVVGALADNYVEKRRREEASMDMADVESTAPTTLMDQAEQLFFFKLDDITRIKGANSYVELRLLKGRALFRWMDPRQSVKPRRMLLDAYVGAVNAGRDIMADCRQFM